MPLRPIIVPPGAPDDAPRRNMDIGRRNLRPGSDGVDHWRTKLQPASFRGIAFHVDLGARASGRRVVVHEYPKRNVPYSEDMGRRARRWHLQAYHIGPYYLALRDMLVEALEADGPGTLTLPLAYKSETVQVMAGPYTMNESRERGGFVAWEMEFTEAGVPGFFTEMLETASQIGEAADALERRARDGSSGA